MISPNRGERLFNLLSSLPVFNTLDFVGINEIGAVSFKRGPNSLRVEMPQVEGDQQVFDTFMSEYGNETHSQRSFDLSEVAAFVEKAYAHLKTSTI